MTSRFELEKPELLSEWDAFLQDGTIPNAHISPRDQYLYGKILHDLLQYLNAYRAYSQLILGLHREGIVPAITLNWIRSKEFVFEHMAKQVSEFWQFHRDIKTYRSRWPELIQEVGSQVNSLSTLIAELENLPLPSEEGHFKDWMLVGIRNLRKAETMLTAIYARDYKSLWWSSDDEARRLLDQS